MSLCCRLALTQPALSVSLVLTLALHAWPILPFVGLLSTTCSRYRSHQSMPVALSSAFFLKVVAFKTSQVSFSSTLLYEFSNIQDTGKNNIENIHNQIPPSTFITLHICLFIPSYSPIMCSSYSRMYLKVNYFLHPEVLGYDYHQLKFNVISVSSPNCLGPNNQLRCWM